tara:strand:+ start:490 stop:5976 length:5487 start_codon:yes stop_codon:yes gene_type:complete
MSQTFFLENKRYDIPSELTTDFLNKNPNAVKGLNYVSDDKTYLIPETLQDKFIQRNPNAVLQEESLKQESNINYEDPGLSETNDTLNLNLQRQKEELSAKQDTVVAETETIEAPKQESKDRGLFSKLGEKMTRNMQNSKLNQLSYLAYTNFPGAPSVEEIKELKKEYNERAQRDPIKADNWFEDILLASAGFVGSFATGATEGGIPGAAAGMSGAALAGTLSPLAPLAEEVFTIPAAGAVGFQTGASIFWAQQGAGEVMTNMIDRGVDSKLSAYMGTIAGVPYALLEKLQVGKLIPQSLQKEANAVVTKSVANTISKWTKKYGESYVTNIVQEDLQLATTALAEEVGIFLKNKVDDGDIKQRTMDGFLDELKQTTIETAKGLIPLTAGQITVDVGVGSLKPQDVMSGIIDTKDKIEEQPLVEEKQPKTEVSPKTEPVEAPVEAETQVEPDQVSPEIEPKVESEVDLDRDAPTPQDVETAPEVTDEVTPEITEETIAEETEESISDRFNEGNVDQKIFTEKVDEEALSDKRLPGGSVRNVYNIDGKVIKVAKSPRGLEQNISMGFGDYDILDGKVPELFEVGKDYIVTENVPRNDTETRKFLKPLQKFTAQDWDNKTAELQEVLRELGLESFMDYNVLWNDFTAHRNWGQRENGDFVLIDEGALNKEVTSTSEIPSWARQEWEEVKRMRRQQRTALRQRQQEQEIVEQQEVEAPVETEKPTTTGRKVEQTKVLNEQYQNALDAQDAAQATLLRDDLGGQQRRKAQESFDKATRLVGELELEGETNQLQIEGRRTETDAINEVVSFFEEIDPDVDYQVTLDETRTIYDAVEDPKSPETLESALLAVESAGKELEGVPLSEIELTGENYREARDGGLVDVIKINKGADVGTVVEERSEAWYSSQEDIVEGFDDKIGELRKQYFKSTKETDDTNQSNKEWFSDRVKDYVFSKKTRKNLPNRLVRILDKFKKYAKELTKRAKKFGDYVKKNKVSPELQDMLQRSVTEGIQVQPTKQKAPGYEMRRRNKTSRERARRDEQTRRRTLKENYEDLKAGNTALYDEQVAEQIEREERTGVKSPIYAGSINVDKQKIDDVLKSFQISLSKLQPKKKVSWDETGRIRDEILKDFDKSARLLLKAKRQGILKTEELDALRQIHANCLYRLKEMAETSPDQAAFRAVENFYNDIFTVLSDVSSEAGRTLNILKRDVAERRLGAAIAKLENGMSEYQKEQFANINVENPLEVIRFAESLEKPTLMDYVYEFWYNSILSGIPTHLVNIGSNTLWMSFQVPQRVLSGSVDALITRFNGKERSRYVNEIIPMMAGMKEGFKKGKKRAKEVMKTGQIPIELDTKWDLELGSSQGAWARSPSEFMRNAAPYVSVVGRALRAMDVWANSIAFDADINAQAKRIANQEGLKGEAAQNREIELRREPSNDMVENAKSFAKYTTFMDNPGKLAQGISDLRSKTPGGRFFVPFVNTLANITKRGYEFVPGLGLMKRKSLQGKGQYQDSASDIIAKQVVGSVLAFALLSKYEDEEVTGAVPRDKAKREAFYRQGKLPWSIKFGDKWISYRRIEPFNTVLASVTIAAETMKKYSEDEIDKASEAFFELVMGLKQNFIDSTMLKGISDLFDDKRDKNFFERLPGTFIPYSSFWRSINRSLEVTMEGDANAREVKNIADGFTQNLPYGLSPFEELKPKLNVWGEEIVLEGGVLRQWLPFKYRTEKPDALEKELERVGVYPRIPENKYNHYDSKKGDDVKLDIPNKIYDEARIYYGSLLKKSLTAAMEATKNNRPAEAAIAYDKVIRKIKKVYFGKLRKEMKGTIDEYNKKNYPKDS